MKDIERFNCCNESIVLVILGQLKERTKSMNEYLIQWNGGSQRVNSIDRAKDTLMYAGQREGDLYLINPADREQCKFDQHIKLF